MRQEDRQQLVQSVQRILADVDATDGIQLLVIIAFLSQSTRMDLNKKSKPKQKTITASKGTP